MEFNRASVCIFVFTQNPFKTMSRSFHATFSQVKGKTKKELNELAKDPESILDELATKSQTKKRVVAKRKENKRIE